MTDNTRYRMKRTHGGRPIVIILYEINENIVMAKYEKDGTEVLVRKDLLIPA